MPRSFLTATLAIVSALALELLLAHPASADPQAFAERSKVIANGNQIRLFGLPTRNSSGTTTKYYDVTVTLNLGGAGKPTSRATVDVALPPGVDEADFAEGDFLRDASTCKLSSEPQGGRLAVTLHCVSNSDPGSTFDFLWFTGPIDGTHPIKAQLDVVGIASSPANDLLGWGTVSGREGSINLISPCSAVVTDIVSARQVDDVLTVTLYKDNDALPDCSFTALRDVL